MNDFTPTFILTWNPNRFHWTDYYRAVISNEKFNTDWTCHTTAPMPGDKFIMLMQGMGEKNGIVATGEIISGTFPYWDQTMIDIEIIRLWSYERDNYIKTTTLREMFPEQCFTPRSSGIRIKSYYTQDLWKLIDNS